MHNLIILIFIIFLDPESGSQKATLVVLLVVVRISSLRVKISKAFLIRSGVQQNFAHINADIAHRSTIITFSTYFLINE